MAEESADGQEKTEQATDERREQFREKGDIAQSRDITTTLSLLTALLCVSYFASTGFVKLQNLFTLQFMRIEFYRVDQKNLMGFFYSVWKTVLELIVPIFVAVSAVSMAATFAQTRMNFSLERLEFDFNKLNPLQGFTRMFSPQTFMELIKGFVKMVLIGVISYLILSGETKTIPSLLYVHPLLSTQYWGSITKSLFWSVTILLVFIAVGDYLFNFLSMEKKMMMTKQELKEDYKQREVDPQVKNRMRRMQRDLASRKTVQATKRATVVITNPTHYAVAIQYEVGMRAPILLAKGADYIAQQMRETAKEENIPIVENPPLARAIFKIVKINQEIPETLYKAMSEVIRYVFNLKGIKLARSQTARRKTQEVAVQMPDIMPDPENIPEQNREP